MNEYLTDRMFALLILVSAVCLVLFKHPDAAFGVGIGGGILLGAKFFIEGVMS